MTLEVIAERAPLETDKHGVIQRTKISIMTLYGDFCAVILP